MAPRQSDKYAVGTVYNYLTITKRLPPLAYPSGKRKFQCECVCTCGKLIVIEPYDLSKKRPQKSCGCKRSGLISTAKSSHGHTSGGIQSRTWRCWRAAVGRCFNLNSDRYQYYGGRGITMCDRWRNSFESFLEDMGECPSESHSIDRFPNQAGNYEPGNCRWATKSQQAENRKTSKMFTVNGVTACISEHARQHNLPPSKVNQRLRNGWTIEQALQIASR